LRIYEPKGLGPVEHGAMENMAFTLNQLTASATFMHKLQMKTSVSKKHCPEIMSEKLNKVAKAKSRVRQQCSRMVCNNHDSWLFFCKLLALKTV
jgi:hypothetical protein